MKYPKIIFIIFIAFTLSGCSEEIRTESKKDAILKPIYIFVENYQPGGIEAVAPYVTPHFRRQQSRLEWIAYVESMLDSFGYRRISSEVIDVAVDNDLAVVKVHTQIDTIFGNVRQDEIFRVVLDSDGWKIDGLQIVDEVIDAPKIEM
jgi:PBP1b-binding outer membrane lipoprotein LpoB